MIYRRLCLVTIIFCIIVSSAIPSFASGIQTHQIENTYKAEVLKNLGLFSGTDNGFELERQPSRIEGSIMLVRLLGKESEAISQKYKHPFKDVPSWASPYVGYMYSNGLTSGNSSTEFGSSDKLSLEQYLSFVLRALGYDDKSGDFHWDASGQKAVEIGLLTRDELDVIQQKVIFLRDDIVGISYNSLKTNLKGSNKTLTQKLIDDKIITDEIAIENGVYTNTNNSDIEKPDNIAYDSAFGGFAVTKDGWTYFVSFDINPGIYKMKNDGTKISKIDNEMGVCFNITGNQIIFQRGDYLYKMNLDGSKGTKICDDKVENVYYKDGWLYYINLSDGVASLNGGRNNYKDVKDIKPTDSVQQIRGELYKIRLDGTEKTKISNRPIRQYWVTGSSIFYYDFKDDDGFSQSDLEGNNYRLLSDYSPVCVKETNEFIYAALIKHHQDYHIVKMSKGGKKLNSIDTGYLKDVFFRDYIYYKESSDGSYECPIYRMNYDGTDKKTLFDGKCYYFDVAGDWIYYQANLEGKGRQLYRMKTDGTSKQMLMLNKWESID